MDEPIKIPIASIQSSGEGFLKRNDIERIDISDCQVSESGIIGSVDDRTFHFALYCIIPDFASEEGNCKTTSRNALHYGKRGLSVFAQEGTSKELKLILDRGSFDIGLYTYHKPEIIQNAFGKLLYIPIELDGTGHGNESDYYIWDNELRGWKPLNSTRWLEDLSKYLPPGTFVGNGVWPNISSMTAEIYLSRKNDPNCCPSGGIAQVKLKVKDDRFQIDTVKIIKD